MSIDGSLSSFDLTHRDSFQSPLPGNGSTGSRSSLDADFLNLPAHALYKTEQYAQCLVGVEPTNAQSSALSWGLQRWGITYRNTDPRGYLSVSLPLSPAFLEDVGVIPTQTVAAANPQVSLAQSIGLAWPSYPSATGNSYGNGNASTVPQPGWVSQLLSTPLVKVSARLIGASTTQTLSFENMKFFDAGTGIDPRLSGTVRYSTPSQRNNAIPAAYIEIALLIANWVQ